MLIQSSRSLFHSSAPCKTIPVIESRAQFAHVFDVQKVSTIISHNPRTLSLGKQFGLETIQRVFAVDSTGFEAALESVDTQSVDLLDISPALVIPYVVPPYLETPRHLCRSLSSPPA